MGSVNDIGMIELLESIKGRYLSMIHRTLTGGPHTASSAHGGAQAVQLAGQNAGGCREVSAVALTRELVADIVTRGPPDAAC
jgi:hypothetical protein